MLKKESEKVNIKALVPIYIREILDENNFTEPFKFL